MLGRKRLKERALKSNYFRSKSMAKVTYRGVVYDTKDNKSCTKSVAELKYRGIKHTEELLVCAK